jgi:hypothetical protein
MSLFLYLSFSYPYEEKYIKSYFSLIYPKYRISPQKIQRAPYSFCGQTKREYMKWSLPLLSLMIYGGGTGMIRIERKGEIGNGDK